MIGVKKSKEFSILFNTSFVVFYRYQRNIKSMNSRIDTLLKKFELEDRKFCGRIEKYMLKKMKETSMMSYILKEKRQKTLWLKL